MVKNGLNQWLNEPKVLVGMKITYVVYIAIAMTIIFFVFTTGMIFGCVESQVLATVLCITILFVIWIMAFRGGKEALEQFRM